MDRQSIIKQYTDEIIELIKFNTATPETIRATLHCALTDYQEVISEHMLNTLKEALASLERGRE